MKIFNKNEWKKVKLGDICDLRNGVAIKSEDYILNSNTLNCRMSNIRPDGTFDILYNAKYLPDNFSEKYKNYLLKNGDLVIAMTDMAGDPKILGVPTVVKSNGFNIIQNQRVGKLELLTDNIDENYLKFALQSKNVKNYFKKFSAGGVQLNLSKKEILNAPIVLPTIEEQKILVNLFKTIESFIYLRKKELLNLNSLNKSLFTTMFGDIKTNDKNWEIYYWKDILNIKNGKNQKQVEDINGKYPIYGSGGIIGRSNAYICNENSIIIGRKGNINKPILVKEKFWNVDTAFGLEVKSEKMSYHYLYYFCLFYDFEIHNKAVTIPSLVKSDLEKIVLPVPPIELQNKFAERIEKITKLSFEIEEAIKEAENLYNSLISKYFDWYPKNYHLTFTKPWKRKELRRFKLLDNFSEDYIDDLNVRITYHSNAIEGNTLTLNETATIILDDTIPNVMSKREFLEVLNHSDALKFLLAELQNNTVDIYMIKEINKILLNRLNHNAGNFKTDYNYIRGANFETASPSETSYKMNEWLENMNFQLKNSNSDIEKIKIIIEYHIKFERIHPFSDGNGRTGRLIILALMLENNLTPFVITVENRAKYMDILRNQDIENFVSLVEPLIEEEKKRIIAFKKSASLQI